jgi:hypothetical protein
MTQGYDQIVYNKTITGRPVQVFTGHAALESRFLPS